MAQLRAFLLSILSVRRHVEQANFGTAFPYPWLAWEPGAWQPAPGASAPTLAATGAVNPSKTSDALCFELAQRRSITIGRGKCDIQLNDGTVSREHATLSPEGAAGWTIKAAPESSRVLINGRPISGAAPIVLKPKDQVRLGDVTLTFLDPVAMTARVDEQLAKVARR